MYFCKKCNRQKPKKNFYPSEIKYKTYRCIDCCNLKDRTRYPKRKGYLSNYWKKWYSQEQNRKKHSTNSVKYSRKWTKENPQARKAHGILNRCLRNEIVKKAKSCELCNKKGVEAHHYNYDFPLEVVWLCRKCHKNLHLLYLQFANLFLVSR